MNGEKIPMRWKFYLFAVGLIFLSSCTPAFTPEAASPTIAPVAEEATATSVSRETATDAPPTPMSSPTPSPSATISVSPTATNTSTLLPTLEPTESATNEATKQNSFVADHTVLQEFDEIPDEYLRQAAELRLIFRGSSIAHNINMGLDCLQGDFGGRRPNYCSDFFNSIYDRSNWDFPTRGNPGWIQKVDDFVSIVNENAEEYDVFIFLVDYADGIDDATYPKISDPENFQTRFVEKIEALEEEYPDKMIVWTTMSMARTGFDNATAFNEMLRTYAQENGKILFDLADIESHSPEGEPQFDDLGREVLYSGYTDEARAGHLNEAGRERVGRALWWFMARLAGWNASEN